VQCNEDYFCLVVFGKETSHLQGETRFIVFYRISGNNVITTEADRHTRHSDKCLSSPTVLRSLLTSCAKTPSTIPWLFKRAVTSPVTN